MYGIDGRFWSLFACGVMAVVTLGDTSAPAMTRPSAQPLTSASRPVAIVEGAVDDHERHAFLQSFAAGRSTVFVEGDDSARQLMREATGASVDGPLVQVTRTDGAVAFDVQEAAHGTRAGAERFSQQVGRSRPAALATATATATGGGDTNGEYAPEVNYVLTDTSPDGRHVTTKEVTVGRQIRKQGDRFVATVRDTYDVALSTEGWIGKHSADVLKRAEISSRFIADKPVQRVVQLPESDGRTDVAFDETVTTRIGFSVNGGYEAGTSIDPKSAATLTQKSPLSFGANYEKVTSKSVKWSVKDYRVESRHGTDKNANGDFVGTFHTSTHLAPFVSETGYLATPSKYTPSMRAQHLEQGYQAVVGPDAEFMLFNGLVDSTEESIRLYPRGERSGGRLHNRSIHVDPRSPFLSRNVSVLLQSARTGKFIHASGADGAVTSRTLAGSGSTQPFQFELDEFGRYIHRDSQKLLTLRPGQRPTVTRRSTQLDQQIEWQADRIHSVAADGNQPGRPFRLESAADGSLTVERGDLLPVHPDASPLPPWSSYPKAPIQGDFVPLIGRPQQPVPPEWIAKGYRATPSSQWIVWVLREQSIRPE